MRHCLNPTLYLNKCSSSACMCAFIFESPCERQPALLSSAVPVNLPLWDLGHKLNPSSTHAGRLHITGLSLPSYQAVSSEKEKIAYSAQISDVTFHLPLFPPGATVASRCLLREWMGVRLHISLIVSLAVTVESANSLDQRLIAHPGAQPFKIKAKALKRNGALGDKLFTAVFYVHVLGCV